MSGVIYPRFLGIDDGGDFVWELANGRWTWGDDPLDAIWKTRTFAPDHYLDKYGPMASMPKIVGEREVYSPEPEPEPGLISEQALKAAVAEAFEDGKRRGAETVAPGATREADKLAGAVKALAALEMAAKGWAQGAAENDVALGRRDRKPSGEQTFVLADILNMIDDAAREVGVTPVYSERSKRP